MTEQNPKDLDAPSKTKRKKTHFTKLSTTQLFKDLENIVGPGAEDEKKRRVMVYTQREKNIRRDAMMRERKRIRRERKKNRRKKKGMLGGGKSVVMGESQEPSQTPTPTSKYVAGQKATTENLETRNVNVDVNGETEMTAGGEKVKEAEEITRANFRLAIGEKR